MLQIQSLHKSYAVPVLSDVNLDIRPGEVHALVGENGAGKSTLLRIIAGLTQPDQGRMMLFGKAHRPRSRKEAERNDVTLVLQELNLVNTLTVAENLRFSSLPRRFGFINYARLHRQARHELDLVGLKEIDPATPVSQLGVGEQQLIEIAAALIRPGRILLLDEPTAALTDPQIDLLFGHIARLKREGIGILYISHRLEEIQKIADRITVLRDGRVVASDRASNLSLDEIIRFMAGRPIAESLQVSPRKPGREALRVENLRAGPRVRGVNFTVRQGEILGLAGLIGSGRTETLRAIFGADPIESGALYLGDPSRRVWINQPSDAVRVGLGMIPESRKEQGLLMSQAIRANITLNTLGHLHWIRPDLESQTALEVATQLDVRSRTMEQPVSQLSGGNQQKVVLARWILRQSSILLLDEPTRGIDVGTKRMIYQLLSDLAEQGKAVVVASSDLLELMAICDRIAVLSAGRLAQSFDRGEWSQEAIMTAAFSGYLGREPSPNSDRASTHHPA